MQTIKIWKIFILNSILFWHKSFSWPMSKSRPTPILQTHATHAKILRTHAKILWTHAKTWWIHATHAKILQTHATHAKVWPTPPTPPTRLRYPRHPRFLADSFLKHYSVHLIYYLIFSVKADLSRFLKKENNPTYGYWWNTLKDHVISWEHCWIIH